MYQGNFIRKIGKLFFVLCLLFALEQGAFGAVYICSENEILHTVAGQYFVTAFFALCVGAFAVYLTAQVALVYEKAAKKEAEAKLLAEGEDGLPGDFCHQIRSYNASQLRLIIDEQADVYNEAEFAYIKKVLKEKESVKAGS